MQQPQQNTVKENVDQVRRYLIKVWHRWYVLAFCLGVAITVAFLINRYQTPVYVVNSSFITKKFQEESFSAISGVVESERFRQRIEVYQEIPLLKSQDKIEEALQRLDFENSYFAEGKLKTTEIYGQYPFELQSDTSSTTYPYNIKIYIDDVGENKFELRTEDPDWTNHFANKVLRYGQINQINGWSMRLLKNGHSPTRDINYYTVVNHPKSLMGQYRGRLALNWAQKGSAILNASINTKLPQKDLKFMQTYLDVVVEKGLEAKNQHLNNTIEFIDDYMEQIIDTLVNLEDVMDNYRLNNREIINGSTFIFSRLEELDREKAELMLANRYYNSLISYIEQNKYEDVFAPNLIGLDVPPLNDLIARYTEIKWEDNVDKNEFNQNNPLVNRQNEEAERVVLNIYESVKNLKANNQEMINEINRQTNFFYTSMEDYQVESREYQKIKQMTELYSSVYDNLLTRRTDAYISLAGTTSDYQLVTAPYFSSIPVYPNKRKIYTVALLIGLAIPLVLLYLVDLLNDKIISRDDLKQHTNIPIIGSVGHSTEKNVMVVLKKPKSLVAESFRGIRSNINYYIPEDNQSKVIMITSSISGEGKTFCSINLAFTYANAGKKTLLVGADMRKPAMAKHFKMERNKGLSNYLAGLCELKEVIQESRKENLDVIPSGAVPPNPAELLVSNAMMDLIEQVKKEYDIIIVDTPPIGLVSDSMEILRHTDMNLLIVRQDVTFKKSLEAISEMYEQGKFENLGVVFNDIDFRKYEYGHYYYGYGKKKNYGYGYGYGYGYYDEEKQSKKWWKSFFIR